jgi:hypothetical protein
MTSFQSVVLGWNISHSGQNTGARFAGDAPPAQV